MSSPSLTGGSLYRILEFSSLRGEAKQSHLLSLERYCFGILNEIASSFVSLTPRNDGISAMTKF